MAKLVHDVEEEPNSLTKRINHLVDFQETSGEVTQNLVKYQEKMKGLFYRRAKDRLLQPGYLVLR